MTLTKRQTEIAEYLSDHHSRNGFAPTVREIGQHFGIRSPNGVLCHLKALEKKGFIRRPKRGTARTITVCRHVRKRAWLDVLSPTRVFMLGNVMAFGGDIS